MSFRCLTEGFSFLGHWCTAVPVLVGRNQLFLFFFFSLTNDFISFPFFFLHFSIRKYDIINIDRMTMKHLSDTLASFHEHCEHMAGAMQWTRKKKSPQRTREPDLVVTSEHIAGEKMAWWENLGTLSSNFEAKYGVYFCAHPDILRFWVVPLKVKLSDSGVRSSAPAH